MSVNSPPPDDLPLSFYLVKTCKLWVWDFDDTLINIETYVRRDMKPNTIRNLLDSDLDVDFPQWRYFKRLIDFLVTHGKYVGIASFGTYEIIRAYMDRIFGFNQKFFGKQNIVAPCMADRDNRRFSVPPNKNEYIYQLMKIYRVQDFERVVLFDDLPSNISSATAIGVVAVQITTPRNGDRYPNKMYFGPWIMSDLDNKLNDRCCSSLDNNSPNNNSKANLINTVSFKGDTFNYIKSAYGTGIGDRKISKKPEYRWNRMNVQSPPLWQNGNWQTNGGNMTLETVPIQDSTLGGFSYSYWDDHQSVSSPKSSMNSSSNSSNFGDVANNNANNDTTEGFQSRYNNDNDNSNNNDNDNNNNNVSGYNKNYIKYKKIGNRNEKIKDIETCNSCKKITWDWITLSLIVIIFMMVALCFSIM